MRLDVGHLVTGHGRNRLQRADLVGDQVFDLGGFHAGKRPAAKAVQVAIARMRADADVACFRKFHGLPHGIGIAGMKTAGDIDRGGEINHGGVVAHFPRAKAFAEIAVKIDFHHILSAFESGLSVSPDQSRARASVAGGICHVWASTAPPAAPATFASCSTSMSRAKFSIVRRRSGRARSNSTNLRASACAAAMPIALNRKPCPAGICARRPRSADITVAVLGTPPLVPLPGIKTIGWPLPGTWMLPLTVPSETML